MDWSSFMPLALTAVLAVGGWYVAHTLSVRRDVANKRRELRTQYLIEAYRRLEYVGNRPIAPELAPDFEKAIADVQLFGTARQVELAQKFATTFAEAGNAWLDDLLMEMRRDLRNELHLEPVAPRIRFLRMSYGDKPEKSERT